jgi:hypothetical protein
MLNSSKKPVMRPESEVQVPKYGFLRNSGCKVGIANAIVQLVQNRRYTHGATVKLCNGLLTTVTCKLTNYLQQFDRGKVMAECLECARVREECALAFAEYQSCKDEFALTQKSDNDFTARRGALERAQGRLRECRAREAHHRDEFHAGNRLPSDDEVAPKIARLRKNIEIGDEDGVQQAVFDLNPAINSWKRVPDEVVEGLLTLLRDEKMYPSGLASHVLNYFEFESHHLTQRQKSLCIGFLKAHGDQFTHFHSQQVVAELREGDYLK